MLPNLQENSPDLPCINQPVVTKVAATNEPLVLHVFVSLFNDLAGFHGRLTITSHTLYLSVDASK